MRKFAALLLTMILTLTFYADNGILCGVQAETYDEWFVDSEYYDDEEYYDEGIDSWDYEIEDFIGNWQDTDDSEITIGISQEGNGYVMLISLPNTYGYRLYLTGRDEEGDFLFESRNQMNTGVLEPLGGAFMFSLEDSNLPGYFQDAFSTFIPCDAEDDAEESYGLFGGDYSTLEFGVDDWRVEVLQDALREIGYSITDSAGVFGQSTYEAVILFQQRMGLSADGKAGKKTLTALESYYDEYENATSALNDAEYEDYDEDTSWVSEYETSWLWCRENSDSIGTLYLDTDNEHVISGTLGFYRYFEIDLTITLNGNIGTITSESDEWEGTAEFGTDYILFRFEDREVYFDSTISDLFGTTEFRFTPMYDKADGDEDLSSSLECGEYVTFGTYPQTSSDEEDVPIEWMVLEVRDASVCLISRYALETVAYNDEDTSITWDECFLRTWLNREFYESAFSTREVLYINDKAGYENENPYYDSDSGNEERTCRVFALSINEVEGYRDYNDYNLNQFPTCATLDGTQDTCRWWLSSPGKGNRYAAFIDTDGTINYEGANVSNTNIYARPAIWVYCPGDWSYYGGYAEEEDTKQKDIKKNTKKKNEQNLSVDYAGASLEFPGSLFEKSPSVFNDDLAKLGAMLNQAACNDEGEILQLFHKMKIEDGNIENFNYDGENAFSIAHRSIVLNGEEANLIFIVARGSKDLDEFIGDTFTRANTRFLGYKAYDYVEDFEQKIWDKMISYAVKHKELYNKPRVFFITGYSLGGAAANLTAARANNSETADNRIFRDGESEKIFAYTYGAIDSVDVEAPIEYGYENIHNIYNKYDTFGPNGIQTGPTAAGNTMYGKFGHIDLFAFKFSEKNSLFEHENHAISNYLTAIVDGLVNCSKSFVLDDEMFDDIEYLSLEQIQDRFGTGYGFTLSYDIPYGEKEGILEIFFHRGEVWSYSWTSYDGTEEYTNQLHTGGDN